MIGMKKALFSLCTALTYFIIMLSTHTCPALTAQAQGLPPVGSYACILSPDTYFYAAKSEKSGLFILPQTYYVKILSTADDFCKVEYAADDGVSKKLTGYCKTSELTFVDYTPQTPYFSYTFNLTYYADAEQKDSPLLDQITLTCVYYGQYTIGATTYCYVLRGDDFGYVPLPDSFQFVTNPEYETYIQASPEDSAELPVEDSSQPLAANPVQITIIVLLCLLIPILAALILRQPKKSLYEWEEV